MVAKPRRIRNRNGNRNPELPWRIPVLFLAAALVYANSLSAPFIFDDEYAVVSNPAVRSLQTALAQPGNTPLAGRPVTGLTFALNFAVSGLDPAAYRATNIAIHMSCALLLFGIVRRTLTGPALDARFGRTAPDLALATATLWVVHPLTTDAVTYITQRTESLMAFFYLLTLYAAIRASAGAGSNEQRRTGWTIAAVVACGLGMGCKESMVTAPLMVVLYDRIFLFPSLADAFRARWRLYAGLALTWLILAFQVVTTPRAGSAGFSSGVSVDNYLLNQFVMVVRYLELSFWPSDLVINYGPPVDYALRDVFPQAGIVMSLLVLALVMFRWRPAAAFLGAWFFVTLAPSSSFVPIATEVGAERRMYLPLMAIAAGVVAAIYAASENRQQPIRRAVLAVGVLVAIALGAATVRRNREHQSWLTLAETTLERWPSDVAHAAVGGELARLRRDEEALPLLRIGARSDLRARYNLGVTLFNLGRYEEAVKELEVLVGRDPMREEVPWARRIMGHAYIRLRMWPPAITQLRMVLAMTPHDAEARRLLADSYSSYGVEFAEARKFNEAAAEFTRGLELDERHSSLRYNLAAALFDAGRLPDALVEIRRAIADSPPNADAYHLLGKLLALQGNLADGLNHLETAARLKPDDAVIREDLEGLRKIVR